MRDTLKKALGVVAAGTVLALTIAGGQATAEPPSTPRSIDIVGVGSDTTQDVMNAYQASYNASHPLPASQLYSWNALGTSPITPKAGCASITRPNGSGAGIAALQADTTGCIDFARSSRGKAATGEDNLAFFAFGQDAVSWATFPSSPAQSSTNLTTAQLNAIYTCTITNWNQISASLPSGTILPFLPQSGSGTRAFFLAAIGVTTPGACVQSSATLEENNGQALLNIVGATNAPRALIPHSVGKWIAQQNGASTDNRAGIVLRNVDGSAPLLGSGTAADPFTINPDFAPDFLRFVFNVVKLVNGSVPTNLDAIFGPSGYLCQNQDITTQFGFVALGDACGTQL